MARRIKIKDHLSNKEIQKKIKSVVGFWRVQRWMIIYQAKIGNDTAADIAKRFNVSKIMVNSLISAYNKLGVSGVDTVGKAHRQRAYLNSKEEKEFLAPFIELALKGEITTAWVIKDAFEVRVGHPVHINTIYRLLNRNGWRKIEPRPSHPKADKGKEETFKKTSKKKLPR